MFVQYFTSENEFSFGLVSTASRIQGGVGEDLGEDREIGGAGRSEVVLVVFAVNCEDDFAEPAFKLWVKEDGLHLVGDKSSGAAICTTSHGTYMCRAMVNCLPQESRTQVDIPRTRYCCPLCAAIR